MSVSGDSGDDIRDTLGPVQQQILDDYRRRERWYRRVPLTVLAAVIVLDVLVWNRIESLMSIQFISYGGAAVILGVVAWWARDYLNMLEETGLRKTLPPEKETL